LYGRIFDCLDYIDAKLKKCEVNVSTNFSRVNEEMIERFFRPKTDGVLSETYLDQAKLEKAKRFYYALMGWDDNGIPLPEKVEELDIV